MNLLSGQKVKGFREAIDSLRAISRLNDPGKRGAVYESGQVKRWIEVAYFGGRMSPRSWRNLRFFTGFIQAGLKLRGDDFKTSVLGLEAISVLPTMVNDLYPPIKADRFPRVRLLLHDVDLLALLIVVYWMRKKDRRRIPSNDWVSHAKEIGAIVEFEIDKETEDLELLSAFLPDNLGKKVA